MKNSKKTHLPVMGVGPIYVGIIIAVTIVGIIFSEYHRIFVVEVGVLQRPFFVMGILMICLGILIWCKAVFQAKIDIGIKTNKLVTKGIYAFVRNPIYSAFLMVCTGMIWMANNLVLWILPVLYWIFMTILMKCTEEKWLRNLYAEEYEHYCKKVNRCIPWFPKRETGRKEGERKDV